MGALEYLDYLIDTAKLHASGETSIGIQPSELATLKVLVQSEQANFTLHPEFKRNQNGNPA